VFAAPPYAGFACGWPVPRCRSVKAIVVAALSVALLMAALGTAVVASAVSLFGGGGGQVVGPASSRIPPAMLALYQEAAAASCIGLPWTVLAAIGTVESDNGQSELPGVHSGSNPAGAEGPMQFEPATFAAYDTPVPPGGADPPSPYDPTDAVFAAARFLCANGAAGGANVPAAIFAYNHSAAYVSEVLTLAESYGQGASTGAGIGALGGRGAGAVAVEWALSQVGTPYVWGGETPGVGFDCSGLVQAAYRVAGISLPRVAQDQFDGTPPLPAARSLEPGDLVFFGGGPTSIDHVGLYVGIAEGQPLMVDAPHTGADVRVEAFPDVPGAAWGGLLYVGATRPAGLD
jgi:cell wall-associated NlpC family hydrolase